MEGRKRRESLSSCLTLESMSVSSDDDENSYDLVTNSSYMDNKRRRVIQFLTDSAAFTSKPSPSGSSSRRSSESSSGETPNSKTDGTLLEHRLSEEVASMLTALNLLPDPEQMKNSEHWFQKLCFLVARMIGECPQDKRDTLENRLMRHLYRRENGDLHVTLVAASYLRIHPDFHEVHCRQTDVVPKYLPLPLRGKLYAGHFVPMKHIIYGDALLLGFERHVKDNKVIEADPYPLDLENESPPESFMKKIRLPDIFRGFNTHCLILSSRFPRLAARMHNLIRHMWNLIYHKGWNLQEAMDLYDAYFMEFEKSLCSLTFLPMDSFPSHIIKKVLEKHSG